METTSASARPVIAHRARPPRRWTPFQLWQHGITVMVKDVA